MNGGEYSDVEWSLICRGSNTPIEDKDSDIIYEELWLRMLSGTSIEQSAQVTRS